MPGFLLARRVFERTRDFDWSKLSEGIILLNPAAFFTFHDATRKTAYEKMNQLVTKAENYLRAKSEKKAGRLPGGRKPPASVPKAAEIATLRKHLSARLGSPALLRLDASEESAGFAGCRNPPIPPVTGKGNGHAGSCDSREALASRAR